MSLNRIISRTLALVIAALLLFSLASCGDKTGTGKVAAPNVTVYSDKESSNPDSTPDESTEPTTHAPTETDPPENGLAVYNDGNMRYFINGEAQKDGIVGSEWDGFYYADADGLINSKYCDGITVDGTDWCIIEGKASQVFSEDDKTLLAACKAIAKCTDTTMDRAQKLKASFDYIKTAYLEGVLHDPPYHEMDWPVVCANDLFIYGKGDCYSYGAAYAYYAKADRL